MKRRHCFGWYDAFSEKCIMCEDDRDCQEETDDPGSVVKRGVGYAEAELEGTIDAVPGNE